MRVAGREILSRVTRSWQVDLVPRMGEAARLHGLAVFACVDEGGFILACAQPEQFFRLPQIVGKDVWYAHAVHVNDDEVRLFAAKGTGVCHCPSSNMRLASGIAPIKKCIDAGVRTGLGVDGSASNDGSNLLVEVREAAARAAENRAFPARGSPDGAFHLRPAGGRRNG